jgi:hypothetical protein
VAERGGVSMGSRMEGLSRVLSSMESGDEGDNGVIGRGLSGEGVRGMERKGGCLGLSLRNAPSMIMFVVGRVSTRVSKVKDVEEEFIRKMGGVGMLLLCCVWVWASFEGTIERAGGRSGERVGRGGDFEDGGKSGTLR